MVDQKTRKLVVAVIGYTGVSLSTPRFLFVLESSIPSYFLLLGKNGMIIANNYSPTPSPPSSSYVLIVC